MVMWRRHVCTAALIDVRPLSMYVCIAMNVRSLNTCGLVARIFTNFQVIVTPLRPFVVLEWHRMRREARM